MVRITRDGVTYHPDELDRKTGEPLEPAAEVAELSPVKAATLELEAAGATVAGNWWTLPIADDDGPVKVQGAGRALERLKANATG